VRQYLSGKDWAEKNSSLSDGAQKSWSAGAMKRVNVHEMTVKELVERFISLCLAQDQAVLMDEFSKFNRLFGEMEAVKQELKMRTGDQRRALVALYGHPNAQVRLKAAKATLALEPQAARKTM
jgi:hypothetical protein